MITILPLVIIQLITTYIFYERHWDSLSRNMINSLTGEVTMIVNGLNILPEDQKVFFLVAASEHMGLKLKLEKNKKINNFKDISDKYKDLIQTLKSKVNSEVALFKESGDNLRFEIQLGNNLLNISFDNKRIANPSTYIFISWVLGSSLLLAIISILFLRGQVRSIISLSRAAEGFGKGGDIIDFKPAGAREIRSAGIAFIEMKERIKRLIDTRTQMLAGVSHDLKTPLTRIKLITSLINDSERKSQIEQEVDEMNKMISGYLSFARLESPDILNKATQEINLNEILKSIIDKYKNYPNTIKTDVPDNIYLHIRPEYFSRAVTNLIDNAVKYSKNLSISAMVNDAGVLINIDDDGPGIPEDKFEKVFQPFYRLDESRNPETGGVGLGLSIARDIINKHGGDIKLSKSHLGGLCATIILPK